MVLRSAVADLFEDYRLGTSWDEMLGAPNEARGPVPRRPPHPALHGARGPARASGLPRPELPRPGRDLRPRRGGRPFPLDAVPRVISAEEWAVVEGAWHSGSVPWRRSSPTSTTTPTTFRARPQGIIPGGLIVSSAHFHRAVPAAVPRTASAPTSPASTSSAPRRGRSGSSRTTSGSVRRQLRHRQPPGHGQRLSRGVQPLCGIRPVDDYPRACLARARRRPTGSTTRRSSC